LFFSLRFPHQNPVHASHLDRMRYMPSPSRSSRIYHPTSIGRGVQIFREIIGRSLVQFGCLYCTEKVARWQMFWVFGLLHMTGKL
jgi:hypothetical protein